MTLGMLGIIRGTMLIFTGGKWIEDIPNDFKQLSSIIILGLPITVWFVLIILLLLYFFLRKVPLGRYFYAVGDNEDGARLIGIPVNKVKIYAFMISGISRCARWLHICYEYRFRAKSNRYRIRITSNRSRCTRRNSFKRRNRIFIWSCIRSVIFRNNK